MMKTWLTGIVICALACALISAALGEGAKKTVASAGALVMLLVVLSPLRSVRGEDISLATDAYSTDARAYSELAEEISAELLSDYVEEQAALYGYECDVEVSRDSSGNVFISARANISPEKADGLHALICRLTGLSRDNVSVMN